MTPREVIADWLWNEADQIDFDDMGSEAGMDIVNKLSAAGYIIVPQILLLQAAGQLSGHGPCADDISQQLAIAVSNLGMETSMNAQVRLEELATSLKRTGVFDDDCNRRPSSGTKIWCDAIDALVASIIHDGNLLK